MKTVATRAPTCSATAAACSTVPPAASTSPASHTQQATPKLAVPVSTTRTGRGAAAAARRALFTVPEMDEPTWTARTSPTPRPASSSNRAAKCPGLGWEVDTSGRRPPAKRA